MATFTRTPIPGINRTWASDEDPEDDIDGQPNNPKLTVIEIDASNLKPQSGTAYFSTIGGEGEVMQAWLYNRKTKTRAKLALFHDRPNGHWTMYDTQWKAGTAMPNPSCLSEMPEEYPNRAARTANWMLRCYRKAGFRQVEPSEWKHYSVHEHEHDHEEFEEGEDDE
jgi:hypothetical protein